MTRRIMIVALALVATGCAAVLGSNDVSGYPDVDLGADTVEIYKATPERDLHLHVFEPVASNDGPAGAVLLFHGGGFANTRVEQFQAQAERLAEAGIVGIIAEYRVTAEGTTRADAIADGVDAVAALQRDPDLFGIDADRLAIGGSSAGGALAVEASADTDAVVLFNPAVGASSATFLAERPTIAFHSREDTIVPFSSAEQFCDAGSDCTLVAFDEGDHGFFNNEPALTETADAMIDFLQTHGW